MINVSPGKTLQLLQHLEDTVGVSVALTIVMATMALRVDDLPQYTQLMDRHTEVRVSATVTVCKEVARERNCILLCGRQRPPKIVAKTASSYCVKEV